MRFIGKHLPQNLIIISALVVGACATTEKEQLPEVTEDGLVRVEGGRVAAVYRDPGADLSGFNRVYIADVQVAFRKDWLRDQNRDSTSVNRRLTQEDADRIKAAVAQEFTRIFTAELERGGYPVETDLNSGRPNDDLLVLVPAIVDLDVTAPDVPTSGRSRTYTASNGSMTLYLEFRDAITGDVIGKVADSQSVRERGYMSITNSVTNRAEADRMLRRWAQLLVEGLDKAHGRS
jgi:hypothetical protein